MRNTCVIYDSDENYAKRLMGAINEDNEVPYNARIFTKQEELQDYLEDEKPEVLMLNEELYEYYCESDKADKYVVLCEEEIDNKPEDNKDLENVSMVCKYQPSKELLSKLSKGKRKNHTSLSSKIIGVMGVNSSKRTVLSLSLAKEFAKKGHTLFISLEEFAGLENILPRHSSKTLSDALYAFKQNKMQYHKKIEECISTIENFDYIPSVVCAEDISYIAVEDLVTFIQLVGVSLSYDYVIVDIGNGINNPWNLYGACNRLFMPKSTDYFDKARECSMVSYMNESGMEKLLDEIREIDVDLTEECMNEKILSRIEYSRSFEGLKEVIDVD